MKTILLMTDFSDNAKNAIQYAIEMFGDKVEYILLNTYIVRENSGSFISVAGRIKEISEEELNEELDFIQNQFSQYPNLKITSHSQRGGPIDGVKAMSNQYPIDLIVMGTKGASGLTKILIGSVTASIVKGVSLPVLIIPEKAKYQSIKKVVFAVDEFKMDDEELLNPMNAILEKENAALHLLNIVKQEGAEVGAVQLNKKEGENIILASVVGEHVSEEIEKYATQNAIDLIAVVSHHNNFFDRLFHKSVSQELVFHAKLPILALDDSFRD
ncbi:MAG: universal stress protein [Vicingus serpentipes]|nr:universal stress protein [Vicingus serpentipes]